MSKEKVRENPVIPPPVPSQVRLSRVPEQPEPTAKAGGEEVEVKEQEEEKFGVEVDVRPKGTITIRVFENSPYEVDFEGVITGSEVDMAWKAMMKEYRVWKHTLFRKQEENKEE